MQARIQNAAQENQANETQYSMRVSFNLSLYQELVLVIASAVSATLLVWRPRTPSIIDANRARSVAGVYG